MPLTKEVVNWVKQTANGWNRVGELGILEIINEVQNMFVQQEAYQHEVVIGEDYPLLTTVGGTFSYDIDTTNVPTLPADTEVWRIGMVLLRLPVSYALRALLVGEYGIGPKIMQPVDKFVFRGKEYFRFMQVSTFDATPTSKAKIVFSLDPGDTTGDFTLLMYKGAKQLTSENVPLTIPDRLHLRLLVPAVVEFISALQNNTWMQAVEVVEKRYMPRYQIEANAGEQGALHGAQRRRI
jgi:hypothetical protein